MAASITFDFRHYYQKGDRRSSGQIAYQWDLGHDAEIYVPVNALYEIHYCFQDFTQTEDYAVESIAAAEDGGYKLTAHIPNKYFERSGELRVYVIGSADDHILTTYEGFITIRGRIKPDDYTDDDPENGAETIIARARRYANESEAWAVGQIKGTDVPSTDPQYNNNSKYYATQAATSASQASTSASQASGSASSASSYASQAANSMNIADQAADAAYEQAQSASISAQTASTQATKAQSYAVGGTGSRTGESTDNAKYYKEQAEAAAASILGNFAHYQATLTADQAYKVGEYLTYNGYLYR
ncbi:MAG: hypothetical protein J6D57_11545, partial [Mogibacterium sp.]|nr:hypothetical protein [Mogibacterium sp.]